MTSETTAPGGLAVVFVEPVGGGFNPPGNDGIGGGSRGFFDAEVFGGGIVDLEGGGHAFGALSKKGGSLVWRFRFW